MEKLNKKVIGNAVIAYFFGVVSTLFFFSKNSNVKHPFVLSHVKSACFLHIIMFIMLYIMSYPFLRTIDVLGYSVNTIITASLCLIIFSGILYGMYMAHHGKRITLGEMFHKAGTSRKLISTSTSEKIEEENSLILILAHIPFFGYIIYPRHKELAHIRDISQLNLFVTIIAVLILITGFTSLSSLIMLAYIVYSVFQAIRLSIQGEISTLNLDIIPTIREKYLLQKSLLSYVGNNIRKKTFVPLEIIKQEKILSFKQEQLKDIESLGPKENFHIRNASVLIILFILTILLTSWDSPVLILFLFPLFYSLGYKDNKTYRMPYIYDIYSLFASIGGKIKNIFRKTRKLQKTQIKETIKMGQQETQETTKK